MPRQNGWRQRIDNIAQIFRNKGAISSERAMTIQELGLSSRFEFAMHGRLGHSGIFVQVAGNEYYLDESRLQELLERRRQVFTPHTGVIIQGENKKKKEIADFDSVALFKAMDEKRISERLSWTQVADEIWKLSSDLNDRRHDHPISPPTIIGMPKRGNTSCQHALFFLRWLDRSPESFLGDVETNIKTKASPPKANIDERLRWDLHELYEVVNAHRQELGMTWPQVASVIHCSPNQLIGLRTVRYAIGMNLAMKLVQWLERPAADFIYQAQW